MQNEYLCFFERIDWTQPKLREHGKWEAACFKPALILLIVWDNVTLSSCGHSISQETDSCFRHPIWSIGLYLGRISHAWCQISFICRVPLCPLLSLNTTIVTHHIVGILSAASVWGNMIALIPTDPALIYAQLWLCFADGSPDQGLCLN